MTFAEILNKYRTETLSEKSKGDLFEHLMLRWLQTVPKWRNLFSSVWLWKDFPYKSDISTKDLGIDLVAIDEEGSYWAIQCKCYQETTQIRKEHVDSFISCSNIPFTDSDNNQKGFEHLLWITTTNDISDNALTMLEKQPTDIVIISYEELENSNVNWDELFNGKCGSEALGKQKEPMKHQVEAVEKAREYFAENSRGKLIMACGTGKTYTSLQIAQNILDNKGLVLFLVPSIALLGQSLNAWFDDAEKPIKAICVCSDDKAGKLNSNEADTIDDTALDLSFPSSTSSKSIVEHLKLYRNHDGMVVVFSTYQSITQVKKAQDEILSETDNKFGKFDLIICDEAHRTASIEYEASKNKAVSENKQNFILVHKEDYILAHKRLYMTATPKLYNSNTKIRAEKKDDLVYSMDNEEIFGKEFFRVGFSYAVQNGLLTDYKVLVLTLSENELADSIREVANENKDISSTFDEMTKLQGCINALSKRLDKDSEVDFTQDELKFKMQRAIAFCGVINKGKREDAVVSTEIAHDFPIVSKAYIDDLHNKYLKEVADGKADAIDESLNVVKVSCTHVDGSMNSMRRSEILSTLKEKIIDPNECRIISNVRCLSEGVDVPSLDAVMFLSPRSSKIDIVQSVGRVMRNYHKGQPDEKKYGYIIIPIVVPEGSTPEIILNDKDNRFKIVWDVLNALRAHDDSFNIEVETLRLDKAKPKKIIIKAFKNTGYNGGNNTFGGQSSQIAGFANPSGNGDETDELDNTKEFYRQLRLKFGDWNGTLYARMVEKVGQRTYWSKWTNKIRNISETFIQRIQFLLFKKNRYRKEFDEFLKQLQKNINPMVDGMQAIEMLAQHKIIKPVFNALFENYNFAENNTVSRSMQTMLDILEKEGFDKDTEVLNSFYEDVKHNIGKIDSLEGKQTIIHTIYQDFFKEAFKTTSEKLGIVYTPIQCVDFIIRSVDEVLQKEFGCNLEDENVNILDPFVGTGTFVVRTLNYLKNVKKVSNEVLERKYLNEIFCNEIVLLAYYIADVNIESVFHSLSGRQEYLYFNNICLTDTYQLAEHQIDIPYKEYFKENSEQVSKLKQMPIKVIMGNPPYSAGQKSGNDNAQNMSYPVLDRRIMDTYGQGSSGKLQKSLHDSFMRAFRWSSDKVGTNSNESEGGIVAFISNGGWLDGKSHDGFRRSIEKEFSDIYVFNLRGNQRTNGELSRKEGGKIFGGGSRTSVAITLLVNNPKKRKADNKAIIHYMDIGDYLSQKQKLAKIKKIGSVLSNQFEETIITPNEHGDWIAMRAEGFDQLTPVFPEKNFSMASKSFFNCQAIGLSTNRDAWVYNFSLAKLKENVKQMVDFYNQQRVDYAKAKISNPNLKVEDFINNDKSQIAWTVNLRKYCEKNIEIKVDKNNYWIGYYRPFQKMNLCYNQYLNERPGQWGKFFPTKKHKNLVINISCVSSSKGLTAIITDSITDLHFSGDSQCFPLYWYEKQQLEFNFDGAQDNSDGEYVRHDGIADYILREFKSQYGLSPNSKSITKEDIFYYVYGLLHSSEYRTYFETNLKKSLPKIPIVDSSDFIKFSKAGRALADLHLNYENFGNICHEYPDIAYQVSKIRFKDKKDKTTIALNDDIEINVPAKAYNYVVNGKSAVEWLMDRYQVTQDKDCYISNNCNDWGQEHNNPYYIYDLFVSVIDLSIRTVEIVENLPSLGLGNIADSDSLSIDIMEIFSNSFKDLSIDNVKEILMRKVESFTQIEDQEGLAVKHTAVEKSISIITDTKPEMLINWAFFPAGNGAISLISSDQRANITISENIYSFFVKNKGKMLYKNNVNFDLTGIRNIMRLWELTK